MHREYLWYQPDAESQEKASIYIDVNYSYKRELMVLKEMDFIDKITALMELMERHHANTLSHTFENAFLATLLIVDYFKGSKGALPFVEEVFLGALLHDIGKSAVPKSILDSNKSKLPVEKKEILDLHSQFGSEILRRADLSRFAYFCDEHHIGNSNSRVFTEDEINNRHPLTEFVSMADVISGMMDPRRHYHNGQPKTAEQVMEVIYLKHKNGKFSDEIMDSFQRTIVNKKRFPPFFGTEVFESNKTFMGLIDKYKLGDTVRRSMQRRKR